jgi:hypothetical protein
VADKADDWPKSEPHPPKRDNPLSKTNKVSDSANKPAGPAMSQKSSKKLSGGHHKK